MDKKIKVYVKLDDNRVIIAIQSSIFLDNTENWLEIDEGYGDKYALAQTHYLPKGLIDENGIFNYKYENELVELTDEEKEQLFPPVDNTKQEQEATLQTMMFASARASFLMELPDNEASQIPLCFESYDDDPDGFSYERNMKREYNSKLYKCIQDYKKEKDNPTQNPDVAVSLWVLTSSKEWPEWKQPTGSHDAYNTGDKVSHNDHKYTSKIDGNTTEPGTDERWWMLVE